MPYKSPKKSRRSRSSRKPGPKPTSKSKVRLHVEKGSLPGYFLADKQSHRRKILTKLAKRDTWETIVKRLNVLYIYNKNRHPDIAAKFRRDMKFIHNEFSPDYQSKKRSKRRSLKKRSKRRSLKKRSKRRRSLEQMSKRRSIKRRSKRRRSLKQMSKRRSIKM
jgi:hypothetical protein